MSFIRGITLLLLFQLIGEVLTQLVDLKIPGAVLGMLLLLITLLFIRKSPESLSQTASHLHAHLALLFIPAGVGVVTHLQRIGNEWFPILATLFGSTLVGMAVTAVMLHWLNKRFGKADGNQNG